MKKTLENFKKKLVLVGFNNQCVELSNKRNLRVHACVCRPEQLRGLRDFDYVLVGILVRFF